MNNKQRLEEPLNRIDVSLIKSEHRGYFDFLSNLDIPYSFDKESLEMNCIDDANGKTIKVHRIVALKDFTIYTSDKEYFVHAGDIGGYIQYKKNLDSETSKWGWVEFGSIVKDIR